MDVITQEDTETFQETNNNTKAIKDKTSKGYKETVITVQPMIGETNIITNTNDNLRNEKDVELISKPGMEDLASRNVKGTVRTTPTRQCWNNRQTEDKSGRGRGRGNSGRGRGVRKQTKTRKQHHETRLEYFQKYDYKEYDDIIKTIDKKAKEIYNLLKMVIQVCSIGMMTPPLI